MITTILRDADPAARFADPATSATAESMLSNILATSRRERTGAPLRRIVLGGMLAGTAATVALAVPMPWSDDDGTGLASAYAVTRDADGSVDVTIDFAQFRDPAALQHSLDVAGVRAVVLAGQERRSQVVRDPDGRVRVNPLPTLPSCAQYTAMGPHDGSPHDPDQAAFYNDAPRFDQAEVHLRPDYLPADGTYVIKIGMTGQRVSSLSADVAIGTPPTCS